MKKRVYPIIVTTLEALSETVKVACHVIYIDEILFARFSTHIQSALNTHGFVMDQRRGKRGFFFLQTKGSCRFDPNIHIIHDPCNIL